MDLRFLLGAWNTGLQTEWKPPGGIGHPLREAVEFTEMDDNRSAGLARHDSRNYAELRGR